MDIEDFTETVYQKSMYGTHELQKELERQYLFMPSAKTGKK